MSKLLCAAVELDADWKKRAKAVSKTERLKLPVPRLQLTWLPACEDWSNRECLYTLVMPVGEFDVRGEGKDGKCGVHRELHSLLGRTSSRGGLPKKPVINGVVDTPFRDHAHAIWDAASLGGLPIYAVCETDKTLICPKDAR